MKVIQTNSVLDKIGARAELLRSLLMNAVWVEPPGTLRGNLLNLDLTEAEADDCAELIPVDLRRPPRSVGDRLTRRTKKKLIRPFAAWCRADARSRVEVFNGIRIPRSVR